MTLVGVFDSRERAERAKDKLIRSGVPAGHIALSIGLTADAIAAEAPVRTGGTIVSVETDSARANTLERLLKSTGARIYRTRTAP